MKAHRRVRDGLLSTSWWLLGCILASGLFGRFFLSFYTHPGLNWDEAPQVLMARQIAEGRILPAVHFQLPYIGAVEQYPLALWILVVGDGVPAIRLFYFLLSALSLGATFVFHRRLLVGRWVALATAIAALCPPMVLLPSLQSYSFASLVFFSGIGLWGALRCADGASRAGAFMLGLGNGLGLYNNILFAGVLLFCSWMIWRHARGMTLLFAVGVLLGYAPMLAFNFGNDFISYQMLAAKFFGVTQAMVDASGVLEALWLGVVTKFTGQNGSGGSLYALYAFPAIFASSGHWIQTIGIVAILIAAAIGFGSIVPKLFGQMIGATRGEYDARAIFYIALGLMLVPALGEIRYLTALIPVLPVMVCDGLILCSRRSLALARGLGTVVVAYLVVGYVGMIAAYEPGAERREAQQLVYEFLAKRDLRFGYASHPFQASIAYLSEEQVKISPQIGPIFFDKIPHFSQQVDRVEQVFYVLPPDDQYLRFLVDEGITYRQAEVAGWRILWDFDRRVYPLDLLPPEELTKPGGYNRWSYKVNPTVLNIYRGGH